MVSAQRIQLTSLALHRALASEAAEFVKTNSAASAKLFHGSDPVGIHGKQIQILDGEVVWRLTVMKALRGLFRLGTLTLLALTLMVALTLPSAASSHQVCSAGLMLEEVEIVSVEAKPSPAVWETRGLVKFDYDGDIENGLLEVKFKDIPTAFDFDGYIIEAVPGDDDPGDSATRGVSAHKSGLIARPKIIGDTVPKVLNLEPGTKYYVTVHAVNHNTVQISPKQRPQDQTADTTLLSAPFLGALHAVFRQYDYGTNAWTDLRCNPLAEPHSNSNYECWFYRWVDVGLDDDMTNDHNSDYEGAHFAFYEADDEAGQHYFRWLNPAQYGPYDHILDDVLDDLNGNDDSEGQADMLSLDKDGQVEDHCAGDAFANGDCGHTHYQFKAVDENGNTVASELVETQGNLVYSQGNLWWEDHYFQVVFTAESGELTLSVSLGRVDQGNYRAMSDTASVTVNVPGDLRAFDQTPEEYLTVVSDIFQVFYEDYISDDNDTKGNELAERWLGEKGSGAGRSRWNPRAEESLSDLFYDPWRNQLIIQAHLNNQLK